VYQLVYVIVDAVSLHVLVDVTLQTNVDSRLGSIRCPAVQKLIPFADSLKHPANFVSKTFSIQRTLKSCISVYRVGQKSKLL